MKGIFLKVRDKKKNEGDGLHCVSVCVCILEGSVLYRYSKEKYIGCLGFSE